MTNKQFEDFLRKSIKNNGENSIDFSEELNEPHEFSPKFERKMAKLIQKEKKPRSYMRKFHIGKSFATATVITIASFSIIMNIGADTDTTSFLKYPYKTHTEVSASPDPYAPETIEDIYLISDIDKDYKVLYINKPDVSNSLSICYENRNDNYYTIDFTQNVKKHFQKICVNTEFVSIKDIKINGNEGFKLETHTGNYIAWDNGDYIFSLSGNLNINELIKLAESVQKAEK